MQCDIGLPGLYCSACRAAHSRSAAPTRTRAHRAILSLQLRFDFQEQSFFGPRKLPGQSWGTSWIQSCAAHCIYMCIPALTCNLLQGWEVGILNTLMAKNGCQTNPPQRMHVRIESKAVPHSVVLLSRSQACEVIETKAELKLLGKWLDQPADRRKIMADGISAAMEKGGQNGFYFILLFLFFIVLLPL